MFAAPSGEPYSNRQGNRSGSDLACLVLGFTVEPLGGDAANERNDYKTLAS